jgi:hypothetical protein
MTSFLAYYRFPKQETEDTVSFIKIIGVIPYKMEEEDFWITPERFPTTYHSQSKYQNTMHSI